MQNINFNTNTGLLISLDEDPNRGFMIYPNDMAWVEKFVSIQGDLKKVINELQEEAKKNVTVDDAAEAVKNRKKYFDQMYDLLDQVLGNTKQGLKVSEAVFQGRYDENLMTRFLEFLADAIKQSRESSISKYTGGNSERNVI